MATIPHIAKGKFARYADLPNANDALVWVLIQDTGVESEATLADYDTLSAILAAANDEVTSTGYARVAVTTGITVTPDDTNNRLDVDLGDPSWTFTASIQNVGAVVVCYDPDTTGGTDADLVPIYVHVVSPAFTPTASVAFSGVVAAAGLARAA